MYLLRHGQSDFNLHFTRTKRDPGIEDPSLTADGRLQARAAGQALARANVTRILVSPYTRALQTAAEVAPLLGASVAVDALVRERFAFSCDVGRARSQLEADWPQHDFSAVDEVWWPAEREAEAAVIGRAARFREAMCADPESARTLLVSHWGFLLALTGYSVENGQWTEWNPFGEPPDQIVWSHQAPKLDA